jgi:hypothetical protein
MSYIVILMSFTAISPSIGYGPAKQDKRFLISHPVLIQMLPKFNQFVLGQCPLVLQIFVLIRLIVFYVILLTGKHTDRQIYTHTHIQTQMKA